nr:TraX family protein [Pseudomonas sp. ALS1279]
MSSRWGLWSSYAALLGLYLLHRALSLKIWPVGRWGYLFYPGHLLALHVLRSAMP